MKGGEIVTELTKNGITPDILQKKKFKELRKNLPETIKNMVEIKGRKEESFLKMKEKMREENH